MCSRTLSRFLASIELVGGLAGQLVGDDRADDGLLGHRAVALGRRGRAVAAGGGRRVVLGFRTSADDTFA